jgi:hypothetical protein
MFEQAWGISEEVKSPLTLLLRNDIISADKLTGK